MAEYSFTFDTKNFEVKLERIGDEGLNCSFDPILGKFRDLGGEIQFKPQTQSELEQSWEETNTTDQEMN